MSMRCSSSRAKLALDEDNSVPRISTIEFFLYKSRINCYDVSLILKLSACFIILLLTHLHVCKRLSRSTKTTVQTRTSIPLSSTSI